MPASIYSSSAILIALLASWVFVVDQDVPQPYLDEVFHVPQAQQYCAGNWRSWDPKITTPPGLYLIAAAFSSIFGCSTTILRFQNAVCLVALFLSVWSFLQRRDGIRSGQARTGAIVRSADCHTAMNTVLFPPLFFFAALYYTDVASTLSVIIFLNCQRRSYRRTQAFQAFFLLLLGLWSLLFRQTNIFWVGIYPAAMFLVQHLDTGHDVVRQSMHERKSGFGDSWSSIIKTSWKMKVVYNPSIDTSQFEDYVKCVLSIAIVLFKTSTEFVALYELLIALLPYLALLLAFLSFVIWNGSVVLGDKGNHVATLHLPQMLYIWPYILFFSWPVLLPLATDLATKILAQLPSASSVTGSMRSTRRLPRLRYLLVFSIVAACIIRYNTIIHSFTLADNRHYTFYVFRLLMRPWWMRYAVVPLYALAAWLCIQGLTSTALALSADRGSVQQPSNNVNIAFVLIWLGTTTLQLITAPLVEPRYFILPWLVWRLSVPANILPVKRPDYAKMSRLEYALSSMQEQHLWLETAWYILVNAVTGYLFLYKGFTWPSEPGNVQRFMW